MLTYITKKTPTIDHSLKKTPINHNYITKLPCTKQEYPCIHTQVEFTTWILNPPSNVNNMALAGNYLIFIQKTCSLVLKIPKNSVFLEE